jgi:tetratricopeptide (TPR) repeat protein
MDGRTKGLWCLGLVVALSGCNTAEKMKQDPTQPYQYPQQGNMLSRAFNPSPSHPMPPAEVPVVRDRSKKGLSAETEVSLATAARDAAYIKPNAHERDQMLDIARHRYQQALKTDPKNRNALVGMARYYASVGDKTNAIATLRTATSYYPSDHELHHRIAAIHFQFGEPQEAIHATEQALRLDPGNRTYLKTLALCQGQLNQWDAAFGTLYNNRVMTESEARYFLGRALLDLGRANEAREQITLAANDPANTSAAQFLQEMQTGIAPQNPVHTVGYETSDPPLGK